MATLPEPTGSGDFTPPPAGTHLAVCYRVVDLGTQKGEYLGQPKIDRKVMISWELSDEMMETNEGPMPFTFHNRYTWSMHEKANLRKHLEAWRGRAFTDKDFGAGGFDIKNLLGVGCLLGLVHAEKGGKTYANLSSVSKLPKSMNPKPPVNPTVYFWLTDGEFNKEVFDSLSASLRSWIEKSPEYAEIVDRGPVIQDPPFDSHDEDPESIPF